MGENRYINVINFSKTARIVIAHDAESTNEGYYKYGENKITSYFKYACKFTIYDESDSYTSTLLLSNYINVKRMKKLFDKVKTEYGHVSCDLEY